MTDKPSPTPEQRGIGTDIATVAAPTVAVVANYLLNRPKPDKTPKK